MSLVEYFDSITSKNTYLNNFNILNKVLKRAPGRSSGLARLLDQNTIDNTFTCVQISKFNEK